MATTSTKLPPSISQFSVMDVCKWVMTMAIDPAPFRENSVEGADLLELSDKELEEYLNLKPLQIKKLRRKIEEYNSTGGAASPAPAAAQYSPAPAINKGFEDNGDDAEESPAIFQKYQQMLKTNNLAGPVSQHESGGNAFTSSGFTSSSFSHAPSNGSGFGGRDARDDQGGFGSPADRPARPPIPEGKGTFRGLQKVVSSQGEDLAERDPELEKELFTDYNTGINFDQYEKIDSEATGNNVPAPISSFEGAGLHPALLQNIKLAKFTKPTPIQRHGLSIGLANRDLMACAQTGSGKTASYLFPIIDHLLKRGPSRTDIAREEGERFPRVYPDAIIIAPTRELACQIYDEARKFAYRTYIRPCVVYGGAGGVSQLREMQDNGCHLLIATPGRLYDFYERRKLSLRKVKWLVLDEADRMLDMGFEPQVRRLVEQSDLEKSRQTLMFSATFPKEIQRLAAEFLNDYIFVTIGRVGAASNTIQQTIEYVEESDKHQRLLEILHNQKQGLVLIFVQTKIEADTLEQFLTRHSLPATSIHGDRQQWEREEALEDFRKGRKPYLVATDVAARGLDIPNVMHVINFDMPACIDDYVHRIGRTGRVGHKGLATAFFNDQDTALANDLVMILREVNQPVPDWLAACATEQRGGRSRYARDIRLRGGVKFSQDDHQGGGFNGGFNGGAAAAASGGAAEEWD